MKIMISGQGTLNDLQFKYTINIHLWPLGDFQDLTILYGWECYLEQWGTLRVKRDTNNSSSILISLPLQNTVVPCKCEWYTESISFTFQGISWFSYWNCSQSNLLYGEQYPLGTIEINMKGTIRNAKCITTKVGGGRQISSLGGLSFWVWSCRKMCYTIYITTSHNFSMSNEKLI